MDVWAVAAARKKGRYNNRDTEILLALVSYRKHRATPLNNRDTWGYPTNDETNRLRPEQVAEKIKTLSS
jgi:hypothetical protein